MLIGYARVSTGDQNLDLQHATLTEAGGTRIYEEKLSGANRNRPELARALDHLRARDLVVVSRLDRLARSTDDLLDIAEQIREAEAGLLREAEGGPALAVGALGRHDLASGPHGVDRIRRYS
jgi:DNA invertase Pin-like site-specific DNA recombinase